MGYPRDEQETVITITNDETIWDVYSTIPKHIRKIQELGHDIKILETENNRPIAIRGKLNEKQVSMKKERKMSEEQKKKAAERMKKMHQGNS